MLLGFLRGKPQSFLGIDIGTTSVKIVELGRERDQARLRTYGELKTYGYLERIADPIQTSSLQMLDSDVAQMIRLVLDESHAGATAATISIPVFSSFFTLMEMPQMPEKELREAVPFQARQLIPIPISEVVLDWEVVGRIEGQKAGTAMNRPKTMVLVVAVPKEVVEKYVRIARLAGVDLRGLEVETFSLARSLVPPKDDKVTGIIDFGGRTTNTSIVDGGSIRMSHNLDTSSGEITRVIASSLGITLYRAEALKMEQGITGMGAEGETMKVVRPLLDLIAAEMDKLSNVYWRKYGRKTERYIISGGGAHLPGLLAHFQERWGQEVSVADPFRELLYPKQLDPVMREIGPAFAVAVGLALREVVASA